MNSIPRQRTVVADQIQGQNKPPEDASDPAKEIKGQNPQKPSIEVKKMTSRIRDPVLLIYVNLAKEKQDQNGKDTEQFERM